MEQLLKSGRIAWTLAAPLIVMGVLLLGLGVIAAWNVHKQQQTSSELVAREMHAMLAIEELHLSMREIRYQANLYLRTSDSRYLATATAMHGATNDSLAKAKRLARTDGEQELIAVVEDGYGRFFSEFDQVANTILARNEAATTTEADDPLPPVTPLLDEAQALTRLTDEVLTNQVLKPLRECMAVNQQVVERTNEANQSTAQHLKIGFILLGICGALAGLLTGTAIARTVGRSIVQLNVSVRGVAGRLSNVTGPVTFSHTGDLAGIESGLKTIEHDIAQVVERLQQRETELLRSEQLARVGQLAAGLAHELRNPLMPMKMLVQAAIERGAEGSLRGRSLHVINEEIERLERSIQDFLDFARPPVPEMATVDVREIMRSTLELVEGRSEHQAVSIRTSLPEFAVEARVDRTQIRQLLLNLLLNSLDALAENGVIEITMQTQREIPTPSPAVASKMLPAPAELTLHDAMRLIESRPAAVRARQWLAILIADDGPGIPPALLETLFDPFITTKETGTGLGLTICRRIATAHGGSLTVRNRPVGGAEFTLLLPYEEHH